ncbi:MAG: hypothetical protein MHMPM18_003351 [Marteilia pararefringens]
MYTLICILKNTIQTGIKDLTVIAGVIGESDVKFESASNVYNLLIEDLSGTANQMKESHIF